MENLLKAYNDTNLLVNKDGLRPKAGVIVNDEQVLEKFINNNTHEVNAELTPMQEYLDNEGLYNIDAESIVQILPEDSELTNAYRDNLISVDIVDNQTIVSSQDEMIIL